MPAAIFIFVLALFTIFRISLREPRDVEEEEEEANNDPQIKKLWGVAQSAMRERKPLKAEKALLTILKFDEKNAAAYNRLGILYAKEKHFKEAIECFEIAQSLDNNASSLHNVGLIYLETGKYEKAAMAFQQALELEGDQPGRYIAHAKALEKLGERHRAIEQLETAYSLNPTTVILRHILELYENAGDEEGIENTKRRIDELQIARRVKEESIKTSKTKQPSARAVARQAARATRQAERANKAARRAAEKRAKANSSKPHSIATSVSADGRKTITSQPDAKVGKKRKII